MGHALEEVFHNDGYPFFFVSMVTDMVPIALQRMTNDYNISGYPTGFWDGGYEVLAGGYPELERYRSRIESCGAREVPELELNIDLTWFGNGNVQIDLILVNKFFIPAAPDGNAGGCIGINVEFSAATIDPDGDQLYYRFDFDDGTITDWIGPFNSGDTCTVTHFWDSVGTYSVRVQARDEHGTTSVWSPGTTIIIHDYLAGDANGDLLINILDVIYLIKYKYKGGPPPDPYESGDASGNCIVNILDITYLINFLYMGGLEPVYCDD